MRDHTTDLAEALHGSFAMYLIVDVFRGAERVQEALRVKDWQLDAVLDADVNVSGTLTVTHSADDGKSLIPEGMDGDLSPFGATMYLSVEISAGSLVEQVGIGWMEIVGIPYATDSYVDGGFGSRVTYTTTMQIEFASADNRIKAWGFRFPEQPASLTSVYEEIRRITKMNVLETATDTTIPTSLVYEPQEGGRLRAVQDLFKVLNGVGILDSYGVWKLVPYTWPSTIDYALALGTEGTVMDVPQSMDTEGVFNCVVGNFQDPATGAPITAVAYVSGDSGLGVDSDWGEHTRYISDENVTTQAAANIRVATELATVTQSQRYQVVVECLFNPLVELGDMVEVTGWIRPLEGRVVRYTMSDNPTMNVTLEVKRAL